MNIGRIFKVMRRDVKSGFRDSITVFLIIMPMVLALILMLALPGSVQAQYCFMLMSDADPALIEAFDSYGKVELAGSMEELNERVEATDEVVGVVESGGGYSIILKGNESASVETAAAMVLDEYLGRSENRVNITLDDMGRSESPLRREGTLFLLLFVLSAPGFLVGLSMVDEKESNTMSALNVSPLTIPEFVTGKLLFGSLLALVQVFAVVLIMGYSGANMPMLLIAWLPGLLSGLVLGFLIGVIAKDQVGAIGLMKSTFMPLVLSFVGAVFIPDKWQFFLWWSPFYWMYKALEGALTASIDWSSFLLYTGLMLALSLLFLAACIKKIHNGLRAM